MPLGAPGAQRDAVVEAPALLHVPPPELAYRLDVPRFAGAELVAGGHQVGAFTARDGANGLEVSPGLLPSRAFRSGDRQRIPRVEVLRDQVARQVAGVRKAGDHAAVLGDELALGPEPCHRGRDVVGGDRQVGRYSAETRAQASEVDAVVVAVAGAGAGVGRQVPFAGAVDERLGADLVQARMVRDGHRRYHTVLTLGGDHHRAEHDGHVRLLADIVKYDLDRLGIEHREDAAKAERLGEGVALPEAADDFSADAAHHHLGMLVQRVQAAVGEDVPHGGRPAEAVVAFDQQRPCAASRAAHRGADSGAAASGDDHVETLFHLVHAASNTLPPAPRRSRPPVQRRRNLIRNACADSPQAGMVGRACRRKYVLVWNREVQGCPGAEAPPEGRAASPRMPRGMFARSLEKPYPQLVKEP